MKKETLLKKLGTFKKAEQVQNNQTKLVFEKGVLFQSYDSFIAIRLKTDGVLYLFKHYNYSKTTSKYLNEVFGVTSSEVTKELERKNDNYKLIKE